MTRVEWRSSAAETCRHSDKTGAVFW